MCQQAARERVYRTGAAPSGEPIRNQRGKWDVIRGLVSMLHALAAIRRQS